MKFRPVRGGLKEAMEEVFESNSLPEILFRAFDGNEMAYGPLDTIELKYQGYDSRIDWESYLLIINGKVAGYIDGKEFGGQRADNY